MNITLESIKKEQTKLASMIAQFEIQTSTQYVFPETEIDLCHGEHYAGLVIGKDGAPSYHLILLPEEKEKINWKDAEEWATGPFVIGLPTRREQALLFANLKEQFKGAYYWSCEQPAEYSASAWCQNFSSGFQNLNLKSHELRARAVRRLEI